MVRGTPLGSRKARASSSKSRVHSARHTVAPLTPLGLRGDGNERGPLVACRCRRRPVSHQFFKSPLCPKPVKDLCWMVRYAGTWALAWDACGLMRSRYCNDFKVSVHGRDVAIAKCSQQDRQRRATSVRSVHSLCISTGVPWHPCTRLPCGRDHQEFRRWYSHACDVDDGSTAASHEF